MSTLGLALLLGLTGCHHGRSSGDEDESGTDGAASSSTAATGATSDTDGADTDGGDLPPDPPQEPTQAASSKSRVKFKGAGRYATDLADSLSIDRDELCLELSEYDCFATHNIAMGGVDPYDAAVFEPLSDFGVSSPIAADRIALAACGERATLDFGDPAAAVVFTASAPDSNPDTRLADARRLYQRILRRPAEDREALALADFFETLPAGPDRAQTWAHLGCFAVATTMESLFY